MSQKSVVLARLKEAGAAGVDVHEFVFRLGITQIASRVHELRNEGWDIQTVEGRHLDSGQKELGRYFLLEAHRTLRPTGPPPGLFDDPPPPARPITWDCGCVRSADGKAWDERCADHKPRTEAPVW